MNLQKVNILRAVLVALYIFAISSTSLAQGAAATKSDRELQKVFTLQFRVGSDLLLRDYMKNESQLDSALAFFTPNPDIKIDSLLFYGTASPEGYREANLKYARLRAATIRSFLSSRRPMVNKIPFRVFSFIESWDNIAKTIAGHPNFPNKAEVLSIIKDNEESKIRDIIRNRYPISNKYIADKIFPAYRTGSACVIYYSNIKDVVEEAAPEVAVLPQPVVTDPDPIKVKVADSISTPVVAPKPIHIAEDSIKEPIIIPEVILPALMPQNTFTRKPLFLVKTNLLFNAASALNLEVEIPIKQHWSIAVEAIFPWWLWESKQYCLQVMSGNIEGRYWFGNRENKPQLTGWFAGIYTGGGYYDIEWGKKGYQGEFFVAAGLSGGYAHTINKSGTLRMEYALGVGYMKTQYREYIPRYGMDDEWHLIRQSTGHFSWLGPTRAKISLAWMINKRVQKRGGNQW